MKARFRAAIPALLAVTVLMGLAVEFSRARADETRTAIFAGGCFWCVESDFESVPGVIEVLSGFTGGTLVNPTYKDVSRGGTGHRESVVISYDPAVVSYDRLLYLFFRSIDPTDAEGQFCDRGESYSTAIFVSDLAEQAAAEVAKAQAEEALGQAIVTPILRAGEFYPADEYHQDYYKSGTRLAFSRYGIAVRKSTAYTRYRKDCGRDARIEALWGEDAPFIAGH